MDATVKAERGQCVIRLANGATVTIGGNKVEAWIPGAECVFRHKADIAKPYSVISAMSAAIAYEPCRCESYEYGSGSDIPEPCAACKAAR